MLIYRNAETQPHKDAKTQRHRETDTQRREDARQSYGEVFSRCLFRVGVFVCIVCACAVFVFDRAGQSIIVVARDIIKL